MTPPLKQIFKRTLTTVNKNGKEALRAAVRETPSTHGSFTLEPSNVTRNVIQTAQESAQQAARIPRTINLERSSSGLYIATPTQSITQSSVTPVTNARRVTNILGVPIDIGPDANLTKGVPTGTLFSSNGQYDLSNLYNDFENAGLSRRIITGLLRTFNNIDQVARLPFNENFTPQINFLINRGTQPVKMPVSAYKKMMLDGGYNEDFIDRIIARNLDGLFSGKEMSTLDLHLNHNLEPYGFSKRDWHAFNDQTVLAHLDEDIANSIFKRRLDSAFRRPINADASPSYHFNQLSTASDLERKSANFLQKLYPDLNFDVNMTQFTPQFSGDNIPTINYLRNRYPILPFDLTTFRWGQGRISSNGYGKRGPRPKTGADVFKEAAQIAKDVPRGYRMTETHTSPDSEVLKLAFASRNYGKGPGQTSVKIFNKNGFRNNQQNNGVWIEDLLDESTGRLNAEELDFLRTLELNHDPSRYSINEHVVKNLLDQYQITPNSELFQKAKRLYGEKAVDDMKKLFRGWSRIKSLDPDITDFSIKLSPFTKNEFMELLETGHVSPWIESPNFHIIKNKKGGLLFKQLEQSLNTLKIK